jgi:hypothetical protein
VPGPSLGTGMGEGDLTTVQAAPGDQDRQGGAHLDLGTIARGDEARAGTLPGTHSTVEAAHGGGTGVPRWISNAGTAQVRPPTRPYPGRAPRGGPGDKGQVHDLPGWRGNVPIIGPERSPGPQHLLPRSVQVHIRSRDMGAAAMMGGK